MQFQLRKKSEPAAIGTDPPCFSSLCVSGYALEALTVQPHSSSSVGTWLFGMKRATRETFIR